MLLSARSKNCFLIYLRAGILGHTGGKEVVSGGECLGRAGESLVTSSSANNSFWSGLNYLWLWASSSSCHGRLSASL